MKDGPSACSSASQVGDLGSAPGSWCQLDPARPTAAIWKERLEVIFLPLSISLLTAFQIKNKMVKKVGKMLLIIFLGDGTEVCFFFPLFRKKKYKYKVSKIGNVVSTQTYLAVWTSALERFP